MKRSMRTALVLCLALLLALAMSGCGKSDEKKDGESKKSNKETIKLKTMNGTIEVESSPILKQLVKEKHRYVAIDETNIEVDTIGLQEEPEIIPGGSEEGHELARSIDAKPVEEPPKDYIDATEPGKVTPKKPVPIGKWCALIGTDMINGFNGIPDHGDNKVVYLKINKVTPYSKDKDYVKKTIDDSANIKPLGDFGVITFDMIHPIMELEPILAEYDLYVPDDYAFTPILGTDNLLPGDSVVGEAMVMGDNPKQLGGKYDTIALSSAKDPRVYYTIVDWHPTVIPEKSNVMRSGTTEKFTAVLMGVKDSKTNLILVSCKGGKKHAQDKDVLYNVYFSPNK